MCLTFFVGAVLLLSTDHDGTGDAFDDYDAEEAPHSGLNGFRKHQSRGDEREQATAQAGEAVDEAWMEARISIGKDSWVHTLYSASPASGDPRFMKLSRRR